MDASAFNIAGGIALSTLGFGAWWLARGAAPAKAAKEAKEASSAPAKPPQPAPAARGLALSPALQAHRGLLRSIQERSRFSTPSFERDCLTLFERVAAHCEASYTQNAAAGTPPLQLRALLEQTCHALGHRQALLLPPNAVPEDIEPRSYRWTFGLVIVAMLSQQRASPAWASALSVADPAGRHDALHSALAPWLGTASLAWLLEDEALTNHLHAALRTPDSDALLAQLAERGRCTALGLPLPLKPRSGAARQAAAPASPASTAPASTAPASTAPAAAAASAALAASAPTEPEAPRAGMQVVPAPAKPQAAPPPSLCAALASPAAPDAPSANAAPSEAHTELKIAQAFMRWVSSGLADRSLGANTPGSRVHFVSDGMVLITPGIFNDYTLQTLGEQALPMDVAAHNRDVQKAVCAAGWHVRGPQSSHLHRFQFSKQTPAGGPLTARGLLIQNPQRFVGQTLPTNPSLSRLM